MDISCVCVVIIGRNEGDRLLRCLKSLSSQTTQLVYVDSDSTDDSVNTARQMGVDLVTLDLSVPFTAARARNAGFERSRELYPGSKFVMFVDGDCEVSSGWLNFAVDFLVTHPDVAAVCGRRRERFPERSVYNMLCDIEWDTPIGETKSCGGDVLMRVDAFEIANGYRPDIIAGEEPELCLRLRAAGWKIWRVDHQMTLHDAAMTSFSQWWKRSKRGGYAYAEGFYLHGASPDGYRVSETRRIWIWGLGIPLVAFSLAAWLGVTGLLILLVYPAQVVRLALRGTRSKKENWWRALFLVLGKFPEITGQLKFISNKFYGKIPRLIEYK